MWLYISIFGYGFGAGAIVCALILHFSFKRNMRKIHKWDKRDTLAAKIIEDKIKGKIIGSNL